MMLFGWAFGEVLFGWAFGVVSVVVAGFGFGGYEKTMNVE
jgi:hypothetical protein